jgi:hypothetical protein
MPYLPTTCPDVQNVSDLRKWVEEEFRRVSQSTAVIDGVQFVVLKVPPAHITEGMLVFADGTVWNPGGGRGLYQRTGSAWVKL